MDSNTIERYDRQIRLWGHDGQSRCSNSKVCLINADSLGTEIIRGLCLAGIGSFTILDSHKFTHEDIGSSFVHQSMVGRSRGESAKTMLLDINGEVHCEVHATETRLPHCIGQTLQVSDQSSIEDASPGEAQYWKQFSCIIASGNLCLSQINRLSKTCWSNSIPLIQCKSIGFYAVCRSQLRDHKVIDTHPEWKPANHDPNKPDTAVISTKPIFEDYENKLQEINGEDTEDDFVTEYFCLKALDLFFSTYGRLPGYNNDQVETDISKLKECVKRLIGKCHNQLKTLDQCLYELCRYGGAELHVTSAFMGGCIAQETIKIITHQYVPVDDSLVYNAMTATTRAFKLSDIFSQAH